jgi:hypothetical protein
MSHDEMAFEGILPCLDNNRTADRAAVLPNTCTALMPLDTSCKTRCLRGKQQHQNDLDPNDEGGSGGLHHSMIV